MERTRYHSPTIITQVSASDEDISWINTNQISAADNTILNPNDPFNAGFFSTTSTEMYRIAMRDKYVRTNTSKQLWCTGFNFSNLGTVTGIELRLVTSRLARIQDYVISLIYNSELIGENRANDFAENDQLYGGTDDLWGTVLNSTEIESSTFGVMIELGPNKLYPHSDSGYINSVQLKIYFS